MSLNIVGLYGQSGVGKSTIARIIQAYNLRIPSHHYGPGFHQLMGADGFNNEDTFHILDHYSKWDIKPLKEIPAQAYAKMFGIDRNLLESREWKNTMREDGISNNMHFIKFAEGMKTIYDNPRIWSDALFRDYNMFEDRWIIPDIRSEHDYNSIKERNGLLIKVLNNRVDNPQLMDNKLEDKKFAWEIHNHYSFWILVQNVRQLMKRFHLRHDTQTKFLKRKYGYTESGGDEAVEA